MEPSPLTQQARPDVFQHKVVSLYEELFKVRPILSPGRNIVTFRRMKKIMRNRKDSGENSFS